MRAGAPRAQGIHERDDRSAPARISPAPALEDADERRAGQDRGGLRVVSRGALSRGVRARVEARSDSMTIRAGVVGTGYLGRLHARVLTEIPGVHVAGFVEPNDAIASEVASSLNLKRYDSVAALAKDIDCAVVATPTTTHRDVARELLEAGCDVMIEKPITATAEEAQELIDLAASKQRLIQVGHVERYNPAIVAIADLVSGTRYFESERLGVFVPRSLDVDVMLDLMIHDLNLVLSLLRQTVVEIRAVGVPALTDKVDITNVRLALANGAVANLTASR